MKRMILPMDNGLSRRQLMNGVAGTAAVPTIAALSGCMGGNDGSNGGGGGNGNGDSTVVYRQSGGRNLSEIQYNFHSVSRPAHSFGDLYGSRFIYYNPVNGEIGYHLADDISIDEQTLRVTLSEDFTWENGDPVTSDDVVTQLKLGVLMENFPRINLLGDLVDGVGAVTKTGEYSLEVTLTESIGEALGIPGIFGGGGSSGPVLWVPASEFGGFVEDYADATTDEERTGVQDTVLEFRWELDEVLSNGIATFQDMNNTVVHLGRHEDNPVIDNVPWDRFEHYYISGTNQKLQAARTGEIDFFQAQSEPDVVPEEDWRPMLFEFKQNGGPGLLCNHEDEIFGLPEVKQAIAHVVDRQQISSIASTTQAAPDHLTLGTSAMDQYVPEDIQADLIQYGSTDRAAALLRSVGFERDDGLWYKPDGEQFTPELKSPQNPVFLEPARAAASHLTEFGIETDPVAQGGGTFFPNYSSGSYKFALEVAKSGTVNLYSELRRNTYGFGGGSMLYPEAVEAPPVGEPDGDLVTHNPKQLMDQMLRVDSSDELGPIVRDLVWIFNYTLPVIPTIFGTARRFANIDRWQWPEQDAEAWQYSGIPEIRMMAKGLLSPQ
jgi:peptide/nickel transport system substrate-binding protein